MVCLPEDGYHTDSNDENSEGPNCFVAGWGTMNYGGTNQSDRLLSIDVEIYSDDYCDDMSLYNMDAHSHGDNHRSKRRKCFDNFYINI